MVLHVSFFKLAGAGKLRYPLAALAAPVSLSCDSENAEQYVLYVPYRLTYFKMAHEYGASTPVHANANVKFRAKRNTWN